MKKSEIQAEIDRLEKEVAPDTKQVLDVSDKITKDIKEGNTIVAEITYESILSTHNGQLRTYEKIRKLQDDLPNAEDG